MYKKRFQDDGVFNSPLLWHTTKTNVLSARENSINVAAASPESVTTAAATTLESAGTRATHTTSTAATTHDGHNTTATAATTAGLHPGTGARAGTGAETMVDAAGVFSQQPTTSPATIPLTTVISPSGVEPTTPSGAAVPYRQLDETLKIEGSGNRSPQSSSVSRHHNLIPRGAYRRLVCLPLEMTWEEETCIENISSSATRNSSSPRDSGTALPQALTSDSSQDRVARLAFGNGEQGMEIEGGMQDGKCDENTVNDGHGHGTGSGGTGADGAEEGMIRDVRLNFTLPPGSFATMCLREVMKTNDDIVASLGPRVEDVEAKRGRLGETDEKVVVDGRSGNVEE